MYLLSDQYDMQHFFQAFGLTPEEIAELSDKEFELLSHKYSLKEFFRTDYNEVLPIALMNYTYRRDDPSAPLVASHREPDSFIYFSQNRREADLFINHIQMHRHNFYELLYVIDGSIYQNIENTRHVYTAGACCLMNKNVHHREEFDEYHRIVFLDFSDEIIQYILACPMIFPQIPHPILERIRQFFHQDMATDNRSIKTFLDFIPRQNHSRRDKIYRCLESIGNAMQEKTDTSSMVLCQLVLELLCYLFNEENFVTTPISMGTEAQREFFNELNTFIENKNGCTSRSELEDVFHYSGDYIYRIIGKYTGQSISSYCTQVRLKCASQLLLGTDLTIQQICTKLHFNNTTQFYEQFKKSYGVTPRKYRMERR